uniref:Uncharacterized protein n=1 Tax=Candidatus Kentrum sp. TC TaxID=2126339 RepID=A0A450YPZ3_9GAMM|nr:MAG: hypothetical protein BECKTC1821E_GA0114239_102427 [Candidatus Kentron sp. TC]VFK43608.1 MAG: hypothetical protein BECKTC1821D_GA0114238_101712 [Candidatus Kentron sp. TC]
MIVRPDMREFQILDILIEFKSVSLKERDLDDKAVAKMDIETLRALSAMRAKQREAERDSSVIGRSSAINSALYASEVSAWRRRGSSGWCSRSRRRENLLISRVGFD